MSLNGDFAKPAELSWDDLREAETARVYGLRADANFVTAAVDAYAAQRLETIAAEKTVELKASVLEAFSGGSGTLKNMFMGRLGNVLNRGTEADASNFAVMFDVEQPTHPALVEISNRLTAFLDTDAAAKDFYTPQQVMRDLHI